MCFFLIASRPDLVTYGLFFFPSSLTLLTGIIFSINSTSFSAKYDHDWAKSNLFKAFSQCMFSRLSFMAAVIAAKTARYQIGPLTSRYANLSNL